MSYYTRYLITDTTSVSLQMIEAGLQSIDPTYFILGDLSSGIGDLLHGGIVYGQIELNYPNDDIFEDDITELKEILDSTSDPNRQTVEEVIKATRVIVAVEIGWQGLDPEDLIDHIDPLWDWLSANYNGLLQVDHQGFYQGQNLILDLE